MSYGLQISREFCSCCCFVVVVVVCLLIYFGVCLFVFSLQEVGSARQRVFVRTVVTATMLVLVMLATVRTATMETSASIKWVSVWVVMSSHVKSGH